MSQAGVSSSPGNTMARFARRRNWFITFWNPEYPKELPGKAQYLCTCEDSTKDGQWHGHAFIYFSNQISMNSVKKLFGKDCHCEIPVRNSDCIAYCSDSSKRKHDFREFGVKPMDSGMKRTIAELKEVKDPDTLDWRQYNTWLKATERSRNDLRIEDVYKPEIKVFFITGQSGAGKTRKAFEIAKSLGYESINLVKYEGSFWHGIGTSECAIYDDFRDSHMKPSEFINFIDYNVHPLNVKGGSAMNHYKTIIFTSVQHPWSIYLGLPSEEPKKQWLRRMEVIDLGSGENVN